VFGGKHKERENEIIEVAEFIGVKSYKAKGKRLTSFSVENIHEIEPVIKDEIPADITEEAEQDEDEPSKPLTEEDPTQMTLGL
jgi:topoisomerase-4 subunit A